MGSDSYRKRVFGRQQQQYLHYGCFFLAGVLASRILQAFLSSDSCILDYGTYKGPQYTNPGTTVGQPQCLVQSKFMRVSMHSVKQNNNIIPDWLWIDYHNRINVLVQATDKDEFYIFEQTKYALEGKQSKAIVGGIIEPGETALEAAKREVNEEMNGITCQQWDFLGRYRTDVNRGMGWTFTYLATECARPESKQEQIIINQDTSNAVGAADTERQDLTTISLANLRKAVLAGEFLEIQWTATLALALLKIDEKAKTTV